MDGGAPAASKQEVSEAKAVEAASALAVVAALVAALGAFLSPYLPDLLRLVLSPQASRPFLRRKEYIWRRKYV